MPTNIKTISSALNTEVQFGGITIGKLQNLVVSEDFGVVPVESIGSSYRTHFIPGVYKGLIRASRVQIDTNVFFDTLTAGLSKESVSKLGMLFDDEYTAKLITDVLKNIETVEKIASIVKDGAQAASFILSFYFDVVVKDGLGNVMATYKECILTSRNTVYDVNRVVIMNDVTIVFKRKE